MTTTIKTIGYEGTSLNAFISTLQTAGVQRLIDVRELPLSRRQGFSKTAIAAALKSVEIEYVHLKSLGDPKPGRIAAREGREADFRRIFGKHMKTDEARAGLALCAQLAEEKASALLCFERCHECCHRAIVAQELRLVYGFRVQHIVVTEAAHGRASGRGSSRTGQGRSASRN